jgi:hypothetical protein
MAELKSPKDSTIRKLFALSMNRCAFPNCAAAIIDSSTNTILGEVCHICAQNSGGPRYDPQQSAEERHSFENLVLFCRNHHKVIDASENLHLYTVDHLKGLKALHEENARNSPVEVSALSETLVAELQKTLESYSPPSVYMDFKGALLKAGGDGGYFGGGGGDGGVINIVGVTPSGFHEPIEVNGGDAQAPGAGGGGGGVATFVGRPADVTDLENGLKISTIFLATSINIVQGLIYVLGGGWGRFNIPQLPCNQQLNLLCVVETGIIPVNTMLRFGYSVEDAEGNTALASHFDLSVVLDPPPAPPAQVRRFPVICPLPIEINCVGVWRINISSGEILLARHDIEIRLADN